MQCICYYILKQAWVQHARCKSRNVVRTQKYDASGSAQGTVWSCAWGWIYALCSIDQLGAQLPASGGVSLPRQWISSVQQKWCPTHLSRDIPSNPFW